MRRTVQSLFIDPSPTDAFSERVSAPFGPQLQPTTTRETEFVVCDQSIERTFAWITRNRRMSRDYEFLAETTEALVYVCMIRLMLKRLAKGTT